MTEARSLAETVRVEAAAAYVHDRATLALRGKRGRPYLTGYRGRMVQGGVEVVRHHIQADVGRAGVRRAERVELLDGPVGIDHDQRARQQSKALHLSRVTQD